MCQGNTDPSEDVVCETVPSYAAFAVVEGATYALKPAGAAGTDEAACCVLSGGGSLCYHPSLGLSGSKASKASPLHSLRHSRCYTSALASA